MSLCFIFVSLIFYFPQEMTDLDLNIQLATILTNPGKSNLKEVLHLWTNLVKY